MQPHSHLLFCSKRYCNGNQKLHVAIFNSLKKKHNKKTKPQKHIHTNPQMQLQRCEKALGFSDSLIAETKVRKENMTPTSKQGKVM